MPVNLAAFYVVQKVREATRMESKKMEKKRGKRLSESEAPSLQSELDEIWSLTLASETARIHYPISDLVALLQVLVASCNLI